MESTYKPLVSIITAAYNAEKYITETIKSVQQQTYSNWEYIIADNGSTDKTEEIIKTFSWDERIKIVKVPKRGKTFARNSAFAVAKGKYIANIDSDDLWQEDKLALQVQVMEKYNNIGLVYTALHRINASGDIVSTIYPKDLSVNPINFLLTIGNPITHSSVLIRRDAFQEEKYQDERLEIVDELIVYLKVSLIFNKFFLINEPLTFNRIYEKSEFQTITLKQFYDAHVKVFDSFYRSDNLPVEISNLRKKTHIAYAFYCGKIGIKERKGIPFSLWLFTKVILLDPKFFFFSLCKFIKENLGFSR